MDDRPVTSDPEGITNFIYILRQKLTSTRQLRYVDAEALRCSKIDLEDAPDDADLKSAIARYTYAVAYWDVDIRNLEANIKVLERELERERQKPMTLIARYTVEIHANVGESDARRMHADFEKAEWPKTMPLREALRTATGELIAEYTNYSANEFDIQVTVTES